MADTNEKETTKTDQKPETKDESSKKMETDTVEAKKEIADDAKETDSKSEVKTTEADSSEDKTDIKKEIKAEAKQAESTKEDKKPEADSAEVKQEITADAKHTELKSEDSKMETDSSEVKQETTEQKTTNGTTEKTSEEDEKKQSDLIKKIIRQVEYYFGDVNLGRDIFLKSQIKEDDGWVSMETMLNFNRLKQLSEDTTVITAALKKSTSGLMEVSEDNTKIRRSPFKPLPDNNSNEFKEQMRLRCIYAKVFPEECSLDDIQEFLDTFGEVEHVQMRRQDGKFKGSIFAMFKEAENAKKFLEATEVKYKDSVLEAREYRDEYFKRKTEEKKQTRESAHKEKEQTKEKQEEDKKEQLLKQITKGAILVLKGVPKDTNMYKLKETFNELSPVSWVDVDTDNCEAKIRFTDAGAATTAWEKAQAAGEDGKVKVNDEEVTGHVLEGDDELAHWQDIFDSQKSRRHRGGSHGGRGGHRGRGGRNNFGKRRHDNRDGNRSAKHFKSN